MGTSRDYLTTKSKKIVINGVKQDVYLLTWAYKEGFETPTNLQRARIARMDNVWARRDKRPRYIISDTVLEGDSGSIGWGSPVRVLPDDWDGDSEFSDGRLRALPIAGFVTVTGGAMTFHPWVAMEIDIRCIPFRDQDDYIRDLGAMLTGRTAIYRDIIAQRLRIGAESTESFVGLKLAGIDGEITHRY